MLKNKKINREKILRHGFKVDGENFIRTEKFLDDFALTIIIDERGTVTTKIFDADGEPYTLHLVEGASGSFVGAVKAEHERILNELVAHCFDDEKFFLEMMHCYSRIKKLTAKKFCGTVLKSTEKILSAPKNF